MNLEDIEIGQKLKIDFEEVKKALGVGPEEAETFAELYPDRKGIVYQINKKDKMVFLKSTMHYDDPLDWWYFFPQELEIPEDIFEKICKWENE